MEKKLAQQLDLLYSADGFVLIRRLQEIVGRIVEDVIRYQANYLTKVMKLTDVVHHIHEQVQELAGGK